MKREDWEPWLLVGLLVLLASSGAAVVSDVVNSAAQSVIDKLAYGIAVAEGFFSAGSRPQRNHNPGDLELDITGTGIRFDGPYVVYATDEDGWAALKRQVNLMFGGSHIYNPTMTIREVASHYTETDQAAWAANVAQAVGVSVDTKLGDIPA